jgi:hypothetical protein
MSVNRASTHHQQSINRAWTQCQLSVNRVSTLLGVASCIFNGLCNSISPWWTYWQPFCTNAIVTWSQHLSANERQQSVNDWVCRISYNPSDVLWHLSTIEVLAACIGTIVFVDTVTSQTERQQSVNTASTERHQSINPVSTECQQSVNRVSTLLGVASCIFQGLRYGIYP